MPYLIDGHNLIPHIPGLSLSDPDDEQHLVELLQSFCQKSGKQITIYFDRGHQGSLPVQKFGSVTVRFVREETTADEALRKHLKRLAGAARNWSVVSSDREVLANARSYHARVIPSDEFAAELIQLLEDGGGEKLKDEELSDSDLDEWLKLFGEE